MPTRRALFRAGVSAAASLLLGRRASAQATTNRPSGRPLIGVQLGAHSVFDEGPDVCLDRLQSTLGANAVFVYSHTYHPVARASGAHRADHGTPAPRADGRPLTRAWVPAHEAYYRATTLRHVRDPQRFAFADRDVLATLIPVARKRGVRVFARSLEGSVAEVARTLPGFVNVLGQDIFGRTTEKPCWNHPDYRAFWVATVEDLVKSYPLDGLMLGPERSGSLDAVLFRGDVPACFCEHCCARARSQGLDPARARRGYTELYELIKRTEGGGELPPDGLIVTLLRLFLQRPEILAWEQQEHDAKEGLARQLYGTAKVLAPGLAMGWHIAHFTTTWNVIHRAEMDYAELARYADFLKPCVYADVSGPRVADWLRRVGERVFRELPADLTLRWLYAVEGLDAAREPGVAALGTQGFSDDYVFRETRRCVRGVAGKIPVYAGLGFDIPSGGRAIPGNPERLYQATRRIFEAGAAGVLVSREYDEMALDNLRAVGRAVRDAHAT